MEICFLYPLLPSIPPHDAMMTIGSLSPIGHINYQNPIMERLGNQEERKKDLGKLEYQQSYDGPGNQRKPWES